MDGYIVLDSSLDGCIVLVSFWYRLMDGWIDGWMDGRLFHGSLYEIEQMVGLIDSSLVGWMDEWMDG